MNNLDPKIFYFDLPLYTKIEINPQSQEDFIKLLKFNNRIDEYNHELKENTTYSIKSMVHSHSYYTNEIVANYLRSGGIELSILTCNRKGTEIKVYYYYDIRNKLFYKIGQIPSIADLHISKITEYDKVLNEEKLKEFTRAVGLAANGVGIGSFVYLRRIFEDLIEQAHCKAKENPHWDESLYKGRMDNKIQFLKDYLPEFLVEHKNLYGILSKGIHELEENECLSYFETIKMGIQLILDEKVEKYKKDKRLEIAEKKLNELSTKIKIL